MSLSGDARVGWFPISSLVSNNCTSPVICVQEILLPFCEIESGHDWNDGKGFWSRNDDNTCAMSYPQGL